MAKVICSNRSICNESENCGGAHPHEYQSTECNQCPFDPDAKCIDIADEDIDGTD